MSRASDAKEDEAFKAECDVCMEEFDEDIRDPHILACGHSFCMACLQQQEKPPGGGRLQCPTCRRELRIAGPLAQMPKNYGMLQFIQQHKQRLAERARAQSAAVVDSVSPHVECHCSDEPHAATTYCKECDDNLCDAFAAMHRRWKATSTHQLSPIADKSKIATPFSAGLVTMCRRHPRQELVSYCLTCSMPVCVVCVVTVSGHKNHECEDIDIVAGRTRAQLENIGKTSSQRAQQLHNAACRLEANKAALERHRETALRSVATAYDQAAVLLQEARASVTANVEQLFKTKYSETESQRFNAAMHEACLSSIAGRANEARDKSHLEVLVAYSDLRVDFESLRAQAPSAEELTGVDNTLACQFSSDAAHKAMTSIVSICSSRVSSAHCTLNGDGATSARLARPAVAKLTLRRVDNHLAPSALLMDAIIVRWLVGDDGYETDEAATALTSLKLDSNDGGTKGEVLLRYTWPIGSKIGPRRLHVTIFGRPIQDSPFTVQVQPAMIAARFRQDACSPNIILSQGNTVATMMGDAQGNGVSGVLLSLPSQSSDGSFTVTFRHIRGAGALYGWVEPTTRATDSRVFETTKGALFDTASRKLYRLRQQGQLVKYLRSDPLPDGSRITTRFVPLTRTMYVRIDDGVEVLFCSGICGELVPFVGLHDNLHSCAIEPF